MFHLNAPNREYDKKKKGKERKGKERKGKNGGIFADKLKIYLIYVPY